MFCTKCGTTLPEDARFCPNCGKDINSSVTAYAQPVTANSQPAPQYTFPEKKRSGCLGVVIAVIAIIAVILITLTSIAISGLVGAEKPAPSDLVYSTYFVDYGDGSANLITIGHKNDVIYEMTNEYLVNATNWTKEGIDEYIAEWETVFEPEDEALNCMDYSITVDGNLIIEKWEYHDLHKLRTMFLLVLYDYFDTFDLGSMTEYEELLLEYGYTKQS